MRVKVLVLAALLVQTFCSSAKIAITTPGLTPKAQQILNVVQSTSNKLFAVKTHTTKFGERAEETRPINLKQLLEFHSDFDPLLSDVELKKLNDLLNAWTHELENTINLATQSAHGDRRLLDALAVYKALSKHFANILSIYRNAREARAPLSTIILNVKNLINGMGKLQETMHEQRNSLEKLQFGILTLNRENKNSTRILLINLIDLLNKNIHTVKKRLFELERELKG